MYRVVGMLFFFSYYLNFYLVLKAFARSNQSLIIIIINDIFVTFCHIDKFWGMLFPEPAPRNDKFDMTCMCRFIIFSHFT